MSAFIRYLPAATELLPWLASLAGWLATYVLARALNMPAPLVEAAGVLLFLRIQAFENSVGKSLCPIHLWRWLCALFGSRVHPKVHHAPLAGRGRSRSDRVRGLSANPSLTNVVEAAPHPNPLPAKSGAREQTATRGCSSTRLHHT
jgi:hypothetical protein